MTELRQKQVQVQNQLKKELKALRKKNYADLLVQGTNDSSIVSKRSVEMLYSSIYDEEVPHFFQHFVKKPQRRSPAINRGYWIRMNAIRNCIDKIIKEDNCKTNVIVNLGCGYDPLPFQIIDKKLKFLKNTKPEMDFLCIDIDYPELISLKVQMIKNSPELLDIIGEIDESQSIEGVQLRTKNYAAVGCNMRDLKLFQKQLTQLGLHELNTSSIFIAEVSLAYMLPEHADEIIKETSSFPKSHFLILEQLLPTNETRHPFGRTMLHHFTRLNTPLKCVPVYRTIPDQILRFNNCGFPEVEARDLLGCWDELILDNEKIKVRSVEAFDELEEFVFYTQHYIVLHATNATKCCFRKANKVLDYIPRDSSIKLNYNQVFDPSFLQRKFLAALVNEKDDIIMVGGSCQNRLNTSIILSLGQDSIINIKPHNLPQRMCHTLTQIMTDEYILVGGRNAPHKQIQDCWKLTNDNDVYEWTKLGDMPEPRSRHCATKIGNSELLCFGGLSPDSTRSPFIIYDAVKNTWREPVTAGYSLGNLKSSALTFDINTGVGYIIGGLKNDNTLNDALYSFTYLQNEAIHVTKIMQNDLLQRYGSKIVLIGDKLLLVGGVSMNYALDQATTILTIDLDTFSISSVYLNDELWHDGSMFVGFEMLKMSDGAIACVGGGAVCFGFGSFWNDKILMINDDQDSRDWKIALENFYSE